MKLPINACSGLIVATALFFSFLPVFAHGEKHDKTLFTKHFEKTFFDVTEHALFSVEVLTDDSEFEIDDNTVGVIVHNAADEDVAGADVRVGMKNLDTGENLPGPFPVKGTLPGLYIVSGLDLKKAGRWALSITVRKDSREDRATFPLPDAFKNRVPKGRYSP